MDPLHKAEPDPAYPKGRAFWVGITLIAMSFCVFALYAVIPFLSISLEAMATVAVVGWGISWGLFLVGTLLAGKDGYLYFKKLVRTRFRKP